MPELCRRIADNSEVIHLPGKRANRKLSHYPGRGNVLAWFRSGSLSRNGPFITLAAEPAEGTVTAPASRGSGLPRLLRPDGLHREARGNSLPLTAMRFSAGHL
jgi:hypothetical protein